MLDVFLFAPRGELSLEQNIGPSVLIHPFFFDARFPSMFHNTAAETVLQQRLGIDCVIGALPPARDYCFRLPSNIAINTICDACVG